MRDYPEPQALIDASLRAYRRGQCSDATVGFRRLTVELAANDPLQAEFHYYLAECQLRQRSYLEAARAFRRVADDFPRAPLAPDALLRAGDAYAELWRDPELDPSYGQNAVDTWQELMGRYPDSPAAGRAQLRVRALQEQFARKDYRNGVFYERLHAYDSAIIYFRDVVAKYPQSPVASDAVLHLIRTYARIGYEDEKQEMCGYLRRFHPDAVPEAEACAANTARP